MELLKLTALDEEDLAVISAHMQDAVVGVGDITYLPRHKQFALAVNRYAWTAGSSERRRSGLHFGRVLSATASRIAQGDKHAVLSLLSIGFEATDPPSGEILLSFSGGGTIRLEVECIEAQMKDLGPAWATAHQPQHEVE